MRVNLDERGANMIQHYTDLFWLPLDYKSPLKSKIEVVRERFSSYESGIDQVLDRPTET